MDSCLRSHVFLLLNLFTENDLDGEALAAVLDQGPESLKEAIPSLGQRLKLIRTLKMIPLSDQQVTDYYNLLHT